MRFLFGINLLLFSLIHDSGADQAGTLYWTDRGTHKIQRANPETGVEDLVTAGVVTPVDIALDVSGGKMYWTEAAPGDFMILRADLSGSNVEPLVTHLIEPSGIAVDVAAGQIYWTDVGAGKIQRSNLDGSGIEDLIITGIKLPIDLALDPAAGWMYWTEAAPGEHAVYRARLDGTEMEGIVAHDGGSPSGIAVDPSTGKIYWTDRDAGVINRANTDGSDPGVFLSTGILDPVRIVLSHDHIYWTEASLADFMISRASLDGGAVELLMPGLTSPSGIDFDPEPHPVVTRPRSWGRIKSGY